MEILVVESSKNLFKEVYQKSPVISLCSPGRINLIGEHIDYYGGYVLPAAIDKYITFSIGHSADDQSFVYSHDFLQKISLNNEIYDKDHWSRYIFTAIKILSETGFDSKAFEITIQSDIPLGAGLSSSAALLTGFIELLSALNQWSIDLKKIALLAQTVEHRLGTPCGLMDQYASLFGKKDSLILLDCAYLKYTEININLGDYQLILYNTNVHHALTDGGYAQRRYEGELVLEELKSFYSKPGIYRDFTLEELEGFPYLDQTQIKRAKHAITENDRVLSFVKVIETNDMESAGALLYASHKSLRNDYEVSCPESDYIVNAAKMEGIAGARMMGGGFGGCVLCLAKTSIIEYFTTKIAQAYVQKFGKSMDTINFSLGQRELQYHND